MAKGDKHPKHFPIKQIEYRSFMKTINLFHYPHSRHPIEAFEQALPVGDVGFVRRLESQDPFINEDGSEHIAVPVGDEVPKGYTEAAHLPNVFRTSGRAQGCALGFRLLDEDRIEWLCFDRPIDNLLAQLEAGNGYPLFDLVGSIERGDPSVSWKGKVGGYAEHGHWYEGLQKAMKPILSLQTAEANRVRPVSGLVCNMAGEGVEAPEGVQPLVQRAQGHRPPTISASSAGVHSPPNDLGEDENLEALEVDDKLNELGVDEEANADQLADLDEESEEVRSRL